MQLLKGGFWIKIPGKVFIFAAVIWFFFSCTKEKPTVTTNNVTNIQTSSAVSGGKVTDDGNADVTARGVCWSTVYNPTVNDPKTLDGLGIGSFTSDITQLLPGTSYYLRAYATNSEGTGYGKVVSFTTNSLSLATVTTSVVTSITSNSAESGGNVTADGGAEVTARGVCWNTLPNPTTSNFKTTDGSGLGIFTSLITGLQPNETYYLRAYATTYAGTAYDNEEITFSTLPDKPTLTTTSITEITTISAKIGVSITYDGGAQVTSRGVCWSTSQNPTIADSKTNNGSGAGSFTSILNGLTPSTIYYIRAYATNSAGTGYSNQNSFRTANETGTIQDIEGNVYNTVKIGTQWWMAENLKTTKYNDNTSIPLVTDNTMWYSLSSPGYCWYNNNITHKNTYGALYNWYTANTDKLCPTGWHVASDAEWTTLTNYLGGELDAGGKLKETGTVHWTSSNGGVTNETGFTALPGGYRIYGGEFYLIGDNGCWWSSTESSTSNAWSRLMEAGFWSVTRNGWVKRIGLSIRCVKD
jgi:uncharacterized protein (TIGR02145 family)